MTYYLGLDGGGTKTECVVLDSSGDIVGQAASGASNPLRVGFGSALQSLKAAAECALRNAKVDSPQLASVCAGLAGAGRMKVQHAAVVFLATTFPKAFTHVTTDLEIALEAAVGDGPGVVLVAGTGSAAYGRNSAGETARAGGHGPWLGDEGSAFDIGRRAAAAMARAHDRNAGSLRLAEMTLAALACADWDELTEHIAKHPDEVFPRIFPVVVGAAESGDAIALEILQAAAADLANLAGAVVCRLRLDNANFVLSKSGGVFARRTPLDSHLDSLLAGSFPRATIGSLSNSPAVGAARLGKRVAASAVHTSRRGP